MQVQAKEGNGGSEIGITTIKLNEVGGRMNKVNNSFNEMKLKSELMNMVNKW
jgi:hypothetical protein